MPKFDSRVASIGKFNCNFTQEEVKNEPMFFNCTPLYAYKNGGPITREFLASLPNSWWGLHGDCVFDSRIHMLMEGWYPCIPGWHHDDVPRSTENGQPNYINPEYRSEHLMGLVNGEICPTEFLVGEISLSLPTDGSVVYDGWNSQIELHSKFPKNNLLIAEAESGEYLQFNCDTFHRGVPAVASGWRWFGRLSRNTDRTKKITNEIRRQAQVYLTEPEKGW